VADKPTLLVELQVVIEVAAAEEEILADEEVAELVLSDCGNLNRGSGFAGRGRLC